jgi:hypothetical protein
MADNVDEQQQQAHRARDGGDGGNRAVDGPRTGRRRVVRAPPPPIWLRRDGEDDGRMERVERTPLNVILQDLDDHFPDDSNDNEGGGGNGDDHHDSSESDDENNLVTFPGPQDPGLSGLILSSLMGTYRRYRLRDLTVSLAEEDLIDPSERAVDFRRLGAADHVQLLV